MSQESLVGRVNGSVAVVATALPAGRLPTTSTSVLGASEHEVRSVAAEILTSTWLGLRETISALRGVGSPGSIVVVLPPGGVGRSGHGTTGVLVAGLGALVRTAARELRTQGIAINGVQIGTTTNANELVGAIDLFEGADARVVSGQILRLDDLAPTWPDQSGSHLGAMSDPPPPNPPPPNPASVSDLDVETTGRFAGRVALVTGAVRPPHMGRETALRLASEGADVAIVDAPTHGDADADSDATKAGALDDLRMEIEGLGRRCHPVEAVVASQAQADHLVEVVTASLGRLDVVCHFGGGTGPRLGTGPLTDISQEAWSACLETNLFAPWFLATAAARHFLDARVEASIVLLSSYAVTDLPERYGAFSTARSVVVALAEQLAREAGASGVRVNTVLPLGVAPQGAPNPGLADLVRDLGTDAGSWAAERIPAGRTQLAAETAAVAAFLASDDASFVNGQAIPTSGGAADRPLW